MSGVVAQSWHSDRVISALKNLVDGAEAIRLSEDIAAHKHLIEHFQAVTLEAVTTLVALESELRTDDKFRGSYIHRVHFPEKDQCVFCGAATSVIPARNEKEKKPGVTSQEGRGVNVEEKVALLVDAVEDPKRVYEITLFHAVKDLKEWILGQRKKRDKSRDRRNETPANLLRMPPKF